MKVGKVLKQLRKKAGYTQRDLAKRTELTSTTIGLIERDISIPWPSTLAKICRVLKTRPSVVHRMAIDAQDEQSEN